MVMRATEAIIAAIPFEMSDPKLYIAAKYTANNLLDLSNHWCSKDKSYTKQVEQFSLNITKLSASPLRTLLEGHLEYIVTSKDCTIELAVAIVIENSTRAARLNIEVNTRNQLNSRGMQIMLYNEGYIQCTNDDYENKFRTECIKRKIHINPATAIGETSVSPGIGRLTHPDNDIRAMAWTMYFQDLVSLTCGPDSLESYNITLEQRCFHVRDDLDEHPLRMYVLTNGDIQDVNEWMTMEETAYRRLVLIAGIVNLKSIIPDDYARVGNAIRAMTIDFKTEWELNYKTSTSVPKDVIVPMGGWPILTWKTMGVLMEETQVTLKRDLKRKAARAKLMQQAAAGKAKGTPNHAPEKQMKADEKSLIPVGDRCRRCHETDHTANTCKTKPSAPCRQFTRNKKCRYGTNCQFGHGEETDGSTADTTTLTTATVNEIRSIVCQGKLAADCEGTFTIEMDYWNEKVANHGWTVPDCCPNCRKKKRQNRAEGIKTTPPPAQPPASLITADETQEQHDNDGADDDYMCDYSMSMSDTALITEERRFSEYTQMDK
jgi:hypothetical protein